MSDYSAIVVSTTTAVSATTVVSTAVESTEVSSVEVEQAAKAIVATKANNTCFMMRVSLLGLNIFELNI